MDFALIANKCNHKELDLNEDLGESIIVEYADRESDSENQSMDEDAEDTLRGDL